MLSRSVVTFVLVLSLAACTTDIVEPNPSQQPEPSLAISPIAQFVGLPTTPEEVAEQDRINRERAIVYEQRIASCMADEGFEYIPQEPLNPDSQPLPDPEVELAEMGFGVSTSIEKSVHETESSGQQPANPNDAIVEALDPRQREAYTFALRGPASDPWGGCAGRSNEEIFGRPDEINALWNQLSPAYEKLARQVQEDPRMVAGIEQWAACMAEAGHEEMETPDDVLSKGRQDIEARYVTIIGGRDALDPFAGMPPDQVAETFSRLNETELLDLYEQRRQEVLESLDREALDELQAHERALALADYRCGQALVPLDAEIRAEYELEMIEENRALLEQIRELQLVRSGRK